MRHLMGFLPVLQFIGKSICGSVAFLWIFSAHYAEATEYIKPKTRYQWNNTITPPKSDELKSAIINRCLQERGASAICTFQYDSEAWVTGNPNWDKWTWYGTLVAKYTPPGYPQQTITTSIVGSILHDCPASGNWSLSPSVPICSRDNSSQPDCEQCKRNAPAAAQAPSVGNPIFPSTRFKQEIRLDYKNVKGTLRFTWTYRSDRNVWTHNYQTSVVDMNGSNTLAQLPSGACYTGIDGYCYPYSAIGTNNDIALIRSNERMRYFSSGSQFSTAADIKDRLMPLVAVDGTRTGWTVKNGDTEAQEVYDATGRIVTSTDLNGQQTSYAYSDAATPKKVAPQPGLLIRVTDAFGAALTFTYDEQSHLVTMTDPNGGLYTYAYSNGNLSSVGYPDGKNIAYLYNEAGLTSPSMPTGLTGIVDENGIRYATFKYSGYEARSTEHAGGVNKYTLTLETSDSINVTDPIGTLRTYNYYTSSLGVKRYTSGTQPGAGGTARVTSSIVYDANGNVASVTDFGGTKTTYVYDMARNLETSRTEAVGTTAARTITTEWHPTWDLRTRIAEPKRLTVNTYDVHGNLLTQTVQATTDADGSRGFSATLTGTGRTWTYTYDAMGQMLSVKGPRTDVNDLTIHLYDEQGNLTSVTDALNHTMAFPQRHGHFR